MKTQEMNKIDFEQLDMVAGGKATDMQADSRFLNSLNGSVERMGMFDCWLNVEAKRKIAAAWATVGISVQQDDLFFGYSNRYFLDGKQISVEEARQHAMKVARHQMTEAGWNY